MMVTCCQTQIPDYYLCRNTLLWDHQIFLRQIERWLNWDSQVIDLPVASLNPTWAVSKALPVFKQIQPEGHEAKTLKKIQKTFNWYKTLESVIIQVPVQPIKNVKLRVKRNVGIQVVFLGLY